jgi:hypothetical protein
MSARFAALPVGQGDSFLMERDGRRVLVDGGKSRARIVPLLRHAGVASDDHLDVLVCTHNDKDHAEGVLGLLEAEKASVGEVWLPGRWTQRIVDICRSSPEFFDELATDVDSSAAADLEEAARGDSPPSLEPGVEPSRAEPVAAPRAPEVAVDIGAVEEAIDAASDDGAEALSRNSWPWRRAPPWRGTSWELWLDCLQAAARIRLIAQGARNAGARIRWFDFEEFDRTKQASGGLPQLLMPVNAVELTGRVVRDRIRAFDFLRLSTANRESLVFHSPGSETSPGVLFSADSDLPFALPAGLGLATAPHHGSESNATAYDAVERASGEVTWVRSDGRFRSRPCSALLARSARMYCTRCRGSTTQGQMVELLAAPGAWTAGKATTPCHCR